MAEAESEEAVRLQSKAFEMLLNPSSIALPPSKEPKSSSFLSQSLTLKMAEGESDEAVRPPSKASEMLLSPSSIALPASKEPKSSSFLTQGLAEMVNEDPIRLQNQSCFIREEIVKTRRVEIPVYSSLARLPTFSIGLSSTEGEAPPRALACESRVDLKEKNSPRYFQMPELGARVFVGDVDGCDTVACHLTDYRDEYSALDLVSEYAAVRSFYEDDRPGGLRSRLRGLHVESKDYFDVILSGTELVVASPRRWHTGIVVGNLRGKGSSVSGSSSDSKDRIGDKTIRQPSDIVEQLGDTGPSVSYNDGMGHWESVERPYLVRSTKGSYLKKPKFMEEKFGYFEKSLSKGHALQLTRFDDFVIVGSRNFNYWLDHEEVIDIVRKNASETADVIAAQLVKSWMEKNRSYDINIIVIFLDHKEISLGKRKKEKKENGAQKYKATFWGLLGLKEISQSTILKDDKKITDLKEEEKITTFKEKEQTFSPKMEDKKGIKIEEDYKEKILVGESLPNVLQTSTISLEENEVGVKSTTISSNLLNATVQDDSEASSSIVLIEDDDCKTEDLKVSHHITKWIIYGDLLKRTLLCFFNVKEMQFEFYFEDHESMATIIGLGVPHSKVILECGSPHVTVVEIPKEDWDVVWADSNVIPHSILEGNVLKQEMFPDILHRIANIIDIDNIVSKANNGGVGGDDGKGKAHDDVDDSIDESKVGHDHDGHRNIGYRNGGSIINDKNGRKENDGNDVEKNQDDGKTSKDCKEVQVVVHLRLLPGGVLKKKSKKLEEVHEEELEGKNKKLGEVYKGKGEGKQKKLGELHEGEGEREQKKLGEIHEQEGEQKKLGEIHEEEGDEEGEQKKFEEIYEEEEDKKKEGEGCKGVKERKKNNLKGWWHALKRGENGNGVGNQQERTTIEGVEDGDVDENLQKQLDDQIHSQMVFTFTIKIFKDEVGEQWKTSIQATIDPITFQFPSNNDNNYLQSNRFGWFHEKLQVAFGVDNKQVAFLDAKSCKVLDSSEAKEVNFESSSKENARTSTNVIKGKIGIKHGVIASGEYGRTNGLEVKTSKEVHNSWETNKPLTKGGFSISEHTDLNSQQLKYSYLPLFPFKVKEFEVKDKDERLKMYANQICQLQRVSCEGTWHPDYDSKDLEKYKLEASRELGITRIYNLDLETGEEKKKWKKIWKVEKNSSLCFIQKLEKVVYLNHAMSHLTRMYHLQERQDPNNPSTTFLTRAQRRVEPQWPSIDPLVDVKQNRNI